MFLKPTSKEKRRCSAFHICHQAIHPPEILLVFLGGCANTDCDLVEQRDDTSLHKVWLQYGLFGREKSHCKRSIVPSYKWPTDLSSSLSKHTILAFLMMGRSLVPMPK